MTEDDLDKFIKCLGMLSSSQAGEALNARDMCDRILKKYKLTWADVPNLNASKSYSPEDRATQERAREEDARRERARQERARQEERAREELARQKQQEREEQERAERVREAERQREEKREREKARWWAILAAIGAYYLGGWTGFISLVTFSIIALAAWQFIRVGLAITLPSRWGNEAVLTLLILAVAIAVVFILLPQRPSPVTTTTAMSAPAPAAGATSATKAASSASFSDEDLGIVKPSTGLLSNAPDEGWTSGLGKGLATTVSADKMSPSLWGQLDGLLQQQYKRCWSFVGLGGQQKYVPEIHVQYTQDGSLIGQPVLLNPPSDPNLRNLAESATRAVRRCDPLRIPAQYQPYYDQWKGRIVRFDPAKMQASTEPPATMQSPAPAPKATQADPWAGFVDHGRFDLADLWWAEFCRHAPDDSHCALIRPTVRLPQREPKGPRVCRLYTG